MSLEDLRALAVAVGDGLTTLAMSDLHSYPTPAGLSFETKAAQVARRLDELSRRTRVQWKRELLELVQKELAAGIEKAKAGDEDGSHGLFVDAELHFRQYERGEQPRVAFLAGPDGTVTKTE